MSTPAPLSPAVPVRVAEMEPWEARRILRGCDRTDQAMLEVETAIETGQIYAVAGTIIYPTKVGSPMGQGARLRRSYWTRIIADKVRDDFWERGQANLCQTATEPQIELRGIRLNGGDVRRFASRFNRDGGERVDLDLVGHLPEVGDDQTGRRPDKEAHWDAFWLAIVKLASEGKLSRGYYRSQAALAWEIMDKIGPKLSKNTVDPKVSLIWSAIVDPVPSGGPRRGPLG